MGNRHPLNEKSGGVRSATIRKLAKDGTTWTPTEQRTRDKCLRQFCAAGRKGVEVTSGNSEAFKRGWTLMFGTPEEKARAQAEVDAETRGYLNLPPGQANAEMGALSCAGNRICYAPGALRIFDRDDLDQQIQGNPDAPTWTATWTGIDP